MAALPSCCGGEVRVLQRHPPPTPKWREGGRIVPLPVRRNNTQGQGWTGCEQVLSLTKTEKTLPFSSTDPRSSPLPPPHGTETKTPRQMLAGSCCHAHAIPAFGAASLTPSATSFGSAWSVELVPTPSRAFPPPRDVSNLPPALILPSTCLLPSFPVCFFSESSRRTP